MIRLRPLLGLACSTLLLWAPPAAADLAAVWALDDGTKIKATDLQHPLEAGNGIWDGQTIRVFGARNETVAFQLILEGGAQASASVDVQLDRVGTIANGTVSNNPDTYFIDRNIEIFKQEYLNVAERSNELVWEHKNAMPAGLGGLIPDPLVPLNLIKSLGVAAQRNQGIWVDIYIPKSTKAGLHKGTVTVTVGGSACSLPSCTVALELEVLAVTLPDVPTAKTMLWSSVADITVERRYFDDPASTSQPPKEALRDRHFKLARRHHITHILGIVTKPHDGILARTSGETFSAAAGYYGWAQGVGQDVYSILTYRGKLNGDQAGAWVDFFAAKAPKVDYFLYAWDEPTEGEFGRVNTRAANAEPVPALVTTGFTEGLPNVDIFCEGSVHFSPESAKAARDAGKRVMIYNGTRPYTGTIAIDDVAVSMRVNAWIQFKYSIPRWFYWEATYYEDFQGDRGDVNVWKDPLNFTNSWGNRVNGDGLLFYPGRDKVFPAQDRGFDGPLPSIRLKNWRRGIQDAEYLAAVRAAGKDAVVDAALAELVTDTVLQKTDWDRKSTWSEDGEAWLAQRKKLADVLRTDPPEPIEGCEGDDCTIIPPCTGDQCNPQQPGGPYTPTVLDGACALTARDHGGGIGGALLVVCVVALGFRRRRRRS